MTSDEIDEMLNDENWWSRVKAIEQENVQPHHIDKALNDEEWVVRFKAIIHPNIQPHHIDKALNDEHSIVRRNTYRHRLTTEDQKIEYKLRWGDID